MKHRFGYSITRNDPIFAENFNDENQGYITPELAHRA